MAQKGPFSLTVRLQQQRVRSTTRNLHIYSLNRTFFEFSLGLSRACLGNMISFIKMDKKYRFLTCATFRASPARKRVSPFLDCFPYVCPEPGLVK